MSTRENSKAIRRTRILDTAAALLAEGGSESLTMRRLAEAAELSVNTVYNLIGAREVVISSLVGRVLDAIEPALEADDTLGPIEQCRAVIEHSTELVIARRALTRPLALEIFAHDTPASGIAHERGTAMMRRALGLAGDAGMIDSALHPTALAETVYAVWSNAALRWAQGVIDDDTFIVAGLHGLYLALFAAATGSTREHLHIDLVDLDRRLTRAADDGRRPAILRSA